MSSALRSFDESWALAIPALMNDMTTSHNIQEVSHLMRFDLRDVDIAFTSLAVEAVKALSRDHFHPLRHWCEWSAFT